MTQPRYVPVLKGKEGEFAALESLAQEVKDAIMPLVEAPPVPYDYANERPARSLEDHVTAFTDRLARAWPNQRAFLDMRWFGDDEPLSNGRTAIDHALSGPLGRFTTIVPAVGLGRSVTYLEAVKKFVANSKAGAAIRLSLRDFEEDGDLDLETELDGLLESLAIPDRRVVDVLVDLGDIGGDGGKGVLIARSALSMVPASKGWRSLVLLAASFPEDLSSVDRSSFTHRPRREWDLWQTLQRRPAQLHRRDLVFGDYAISHPELKELDPRTMRMSASIRYTTEDDWLIAKGQNVRQYGFDQYFDLCKELVGQSEYSGRGFSWGDEFIADCAEKRRGPGNATTWRKVGTNHHITLVTHALAKLNLGV